MIVKIKDVMDVRADLSLAQRRIIIEALAWEVDYPIHAMKSSHVGDFGCVRVIDALQEFRTQDSLGETARAHTESALLKVECAYVAHVQKESKS